MHAKAPAQGCSSANESPCCIRPDDCHSNKDVEVGLPALGDRLAPELLVDKEGACSGSVSVYDALRSRRKRSLILACVSIISILVPFSETIYLPALQTIQTDLHSTPELVAASVAIYMFFVGAWAFVWGPACDAYGRRPVLLLNTLVFVGASLGCIFAPNIQLLIAFRALQGAAVAGYSPAVTAVVADIFPPDQRGMACGICNIPLLVGPIVGPVLGGGLCEAFGFRATFVALALFAAAVALPLLLLGVPETHQYKALTALARKDPLLAAEVKEREDVLRRPPKFSAPWVPLQLLFCRPTVIHELCSLLVYAAMFCSLTELPGQLAAPPYSLSPGMIGLAFLPCGIASIIASPIGGKLSDLSAAARPGAPMARMAFSCGVAGLLMPPSLLLFGWSLQRRLPLPAALVALALIGASCDLYFPGMMAYLTTLFQQSAAAASAGLNGTLFVFSGVLILVSSAAVRAVGIGPFFSGVAGAQALLAAAAAVQTVRAVRRGSGAGGAAAASGAAAAAGQVS